MKKLIYNKISNIEQYNEYCNIHEDLVTKNYDKFIDEIELLGILIENYDDRNQKQDNTLLNPVELLKSLIGDSNFTQAQFVKEIDISEQVLIDILNYKVKINLPISAKLASFFAMHQIAFSGYYELTSK